VGDGLTATVPLTAPADSPAVSYVWPIVFTGSGSEYFRIWVVNLVLTLLTLGIYSAWAKVRKATYFRHNTQLDGHVFGYHANPVAILRGRIVALLLLAAYTWAFQFSDTAGLMTVATLCAIGPWLFMRSQQFALANTSYCGLRFGFRARVGEAYRTVLPVLVLWVAPTAAPSLTRGDGWLRWTPEIALMVALPWMHHRLKAYQRRNATYGNRAFSFVSAPGRFYTVYGKGLGFVLMAMVILLGISVGWTLWQQRSGPLIAPTAINTLIFGLLVGLIVYVIAGPYYAARLQQIVWERTRLGEVRFRTEIAARPLFGLVLKNVTLTILTCGLYWPWASVALARYRLECMRVESDLPLTALNAGFEARPLSAAGESAADAFGIDIGL
jgi:uncharacterized membrane protein YjgN (DUF898 family)